MNKRAGPKVEVEIKYMCDGCVHLSEETCSERTYTTCSEPSIVERFTVPQAIGSHPLCPGWCPYRSSK